MVLNYLHGNSYSLKGLSNCEDARVMEALLQQLSRREQQPYQCMSSGTVARCMMALLATVPGEHLLTGDKRLQERPMEELITALNGVGFNIQSIEREGYLPVVIHGGLPRRKMVFVDPSRSSQFVSALMLVAPELPEGMTLVMTKRASSRPYIEMTRHLLEETGVTVTLSSNGRTYQIPHREVSAQPRVVRVESDWSAAAPFLSAAALARGHRIRLKGLTLPSIQGDSAVLDFFAPLGIQARLVHSPYRGRATSVTVAAISDPERLYRANFIDNPDLFPSVAVTCAALGVNAHLRGIANLSLKESDRLEAVRQQLTDMGCRITLSDKEMHLYPSRLHPIQRVKCYGDHRIAMAFAPLLLLFPEMYIDEPSVVDKSFPDFWTQFERVRRAVGRSV